MIETFTTILMFILSVAALGGLYRLAKGPTVLDRILAFDMVAITAIAMVVLVSIRYHTGIYLELVLIFSLLGFFGTVAFVFYLQLSSDSAAEHHDEPDDHKEGRR